MNILKVNNIGYKYDKFEALKDVSFEVTEGLVGVLGPNGAGKTTTMKLLTTLFSIQEGDIFLNELNYKKDLKEVRKKIGYLPQDFSTYGNLTGREFLYIIGSLKLDWDKKNIRKHVDEIIVNLDMDKYIDKKIKQYSGGMKQKLGFAQVLVGDPSIIVVDEPTVGLDPEQRNYIRELFPVISKGRIVFVTTHIVEDIEYYCDYLLVIKEGRLIYKGNKENFLEETNGMLWEADVDGDTHRKLSTTSKILTTVHSGDSLHIRYVSKEPLTNDSIQAKVNLQDAYIIHSFIKDGGELL